MYVLDTDHCVELLRGNPRVLSKFKSLHEDTRIYTTVVTIAELFYGAHRLPNSQAIIVNIMNAYHALVWKIGWNELR